MTTRTSLRSVVRLQATLEEGGKFVIFRTLLGNLEFFQVPEPIRRGKSGIFEIPEPIYGGEPGNYDSQQQPVFQGGGELVTFLNPGGNSKFFEVPESMYIIHRIEALNFSKSLSI